MANIKGTLSLNTDKKYVTDLGICIPYLAKEKGGRDRTGILIRPTYGSNCIFLTEEESSHCEPTYFLENFNIRLLEKGESFLIEGTN